MTEHRKFLIAGGIAVGYLLLAKKAKAAGTTPGKLLKSALPKAGGNQGGTVGFLPNGQPVRQPTTTQIAAKGIAKPTLTPNQQVIATGIEKGIPALFAGLKSLFSGGAPAPKTPSGSPSVSGGGGGGGSSTPKAPGGINTDNWAPWMKSAPTISDQPYGPFEAPAPDYSVPETSISDVNASAFGQPVYDDLSTDVSGFDPTSLGITPIDEQWAGPDPSYDVPALTLDQFDPTSVFNGALQAEGDFVQPASEFDASAYQAADVTAFDPTTWFYGAPAGGPDSTDAQDNEWDFS